MRYLTGCAHYFRTGQLDDVQFARTKQLDVVQFTWSDRVEVYRCGRPS